MKAKYILLSVFLLFSFSGFTQAYQVQTITAAGATISFNTSFRLPTLVLKPDGGAVTLLANVVVNFTGTPIDGQEVVVMWLAGFTLNGNTFTINGISLSDLQALNEGYIAFKYLDGAAPVWTNTYSPDLRTAGTLSGAVLEDASLTLAKFPAQTRGFIWAGDATGRPALLDANDNAQILIGDATDLNSVAVTGDIAITNAGVTSITAGSIVDADVNASAAIAVSKLAALTASQVVTTTAGGVLTTAATVSATLGGTGADNSAATGFQTWNAGTQAVGTLTDVRGLDNLSFVTASQGTYYLYFPFAATVTDLNCRVTSAVSGTDDGEITIANNGGTVMTGSSLTAGVLTIAASAVFGTGYSSTLLTNNTFTAGQSMQLTTAKVTTGGEMHCDVTYTRTE